MKLTQEERAAGLKIIHTRVGNEVEAEIAIPNARMTEEERRDYWDKMSEMAMDDLIF